MKKIDRRKFIQLGIESGTALIACSMPCLSLGGCGKTPTGTDSTSSTSSSSNGSSTSTVANSSTDVYTLSFTDYAALQSAGGSVRVTISATSGKKDLYVTRVSSTSSIAVSVTCTHAGCTLGSYNSSSQQYSCPCHGSVFNASGTVVTGPATQALTSYTGTITSTGIQFTIA